MTAPHADDPTRAPAPDELDDRAAASDGPAEESAARAPAPRRRLFRRRGPAAAAPPETDGAGPEGGPASAARLRRRRQRLTRRRQEALYHLGGLAFELYRRDRLGERVMQLRAREVAELDRTVGEIDASLEALDRARRERRRRPEPDASIGACLRCRAPFGPGARFCWSCGIAFAPLPPDPEQVTGVIAARERERG
jgi:hypothetical protein